MRGVHFLALVGFVADMNSDGRVKRVGGFNKESKLSHGSNVWRNHNFFQVLQGPSVIASR